MLKLAVHILTTVFWTIQANSRYLFAHRARSDTISPVVTLLFPLQRTLLPWWWKQQVPPKRQYAISKLVSQHYSCCRRSGTPISGVPRSLLHVHCKKTRPNVRQRPGSEPTPQRRTPRTHTHTRARAHARTDTHHPDTKCSTTQTWSTWHFAMFDMFGSDCTV
jgi:hypothetical protein